MGAWGHRAFENDTAADWVWELEESDDLSLVHEALNAALDAGDDADADMCSEALAAAEVVAALQGVPHIELPNTIVSWTTGRKRPDAALVEKARRAATRILQSSELAELWAEADGTEWNEDVQALINRLT